MNYLQDGDNVIIDLPFPVYAGEETKCYGNSNNLLASLPCSVSVDLSKVTITLKLPVGFRNLNDVLEEAYLEEMHEEERNLQSVQRILSGETFEFSLGGIKNPFSLMPTDSSILYSVNTNSGFLIEQSAIGSFLLRVNNTVPGVMDPAKTAVMPSNFIQNVVGNYTLTIVPSNYQQNMMITIQLPKEINFSNQTTACIGISGTDSPQLNCTINKTKKLITITDAVKYQRGNPGTIKIMLTNLLNPVENIITSSFIIKTMTSTNFALDQILNNVTANFYCEYPCSTCNQNATTYCNSCYQDSDFEIFFNAQCIEQCPEKWVNTTTNNCTACVEPCLTCTGTPTNCTACIEGFWKTKNGNSCHLKVYYPFPFLFIALIMLMFIGISECITKTESRFKEAFIALISLPEIFAWVIYIVFLFLDIGYKSYKLELGSLLRVPTVLAITAFVTYCIINFSHALMHPRKMVPNSLPSYQTLVEQHKCTTRFHWTISYLITFKYSLILVSYMWNSPQYKGDYSASNWI